MTGLNDPVGAGLAASLARPGGNITGMATMNEEVILKLLGIIPLVLPRAKRIGTMVNPRNPSSRPMIAAIRAEAARLGLSVETVEVGTPAALDNAFDDLGRYQPDALLVIPDNALVAIADQIVSRALARRLPTLTTNAEAAQAGAVVTYGFLRREAVERTGLT
jgi:putative tryptophan/tyrosine transport system substrate-binding protein